MVCKEHIVVEEFDEYTKLNHDLYEAKRCLITWPRDVVYLTRWSEILLISLY
jgi:hypothetical protein